jgi:hypothetical protein
MRVTVTTTDRDEASMLMRSSELHAALHEYDGWLRNQIKYHDRNELQEARDQLYALMPEGVFE